MSDGIKVEMTKREVIERKLMTALQQGSDQVAMLLTEADLELLILALMRLTTSKAEEMRTSIERLKLEAFGS